MAGQKKYSIKQTVIVNGIQKISFANVVCEESELDALLATLEGEYVVMAELKSGGTSTNVTSYNLLQRITFRAEGKANMSGAIFANNGGLVIKNSATADSITDIIVLMHAFSDDATLKPDYNSVKPLITAGARPVAP